LKAFDGFKPGRQCVVNGYGDIYCTYETREFIGQPCEIVKVTKAGLIMVKLNKNPKRVYSFAKKNIDLVDDINNTTGGK
jgi:hypothetical protein